ncbi:uncharacterized protein LOC125654638 [Ostrea edulis]|uniref:uncharacterized protein LOC125654638 n=1 Tax=Ostrea edulis TaxID=37623 RepID=UPI0024AEC4A6|nr:uncharacterized protein LOC125654638 [Ostrea edulis]
MSIHILIFLIFTCEINASCTDPRHDQQQFCGAQNAFTAVVDGVWGPAGDPFDRTYRVTVKNIYRGSDIVPNTTITLYGRSHSCGPTILDIKKEYAIYATKYGPRLEVVTHEEVPPASIARLKMYDCSCQIEIHKPNMSNTLRYEDSLDKCIITTHGRDCQFRNGYCKKTNNLCSWELFPRAYHRTNCVQNV